MLALRIIAQAGIIAAAVRAIQFYQSNPKG
jgi:hypothetical protein